MPPVHPNVVEVYERGHEEGGVFLAMELVDGLSLQDCLAVNGPVPPRVVRDIALSICSALHMALQRLGRGGETELKEALQLARGLGDRNLEQGVAALLD